MVLRNAKIQKTVNIPRRVKSEVRIIHDAKDGHETNEKWTPSEKGRPLAFTAHNGRVPAAGVDGRTNAPVVIQTNDSNRSWQR